MVKSPAQSCRMRTFIHRGPTSGGHFNGFKYHGPKIGEIMEKLGQKEMLSKMQYLDSQRSNIYKDFYSNI